VSDNSYIDPSGWDPGPDYIPTEKNYEQKISRGIRLGRGILSD